MSQKFPADKEKFFAGNFCLISMRFIRKEQR